MNAAPGSEQAHLSFTTADAIGMAAIAIETGVFLAISLGRSIFPKDADHPLLFAVLVFLVPFSILSLVGLRGWHRKKAPKTYLQCIFGITLFGALLLLGVMLRSLGFPRWLPFLLICAGSGSAAIYLAQIPRLWWINTHKEDR